MEYSFGKGKDESTLVLSLDENIYLTLALRYKELSSGGESSGGGDSGDIPFEIDGYLTEIDTGVIDADYMNSRFDKYLKVLRQKGADSEQLQKTLDELHKSFASLSQEEQKYANIYLHDVQSGDVNPDNENTIREHITEYQTNAKSSEITELAQLFGLDEAKLSKMMNTGITVSNINEFGRFDDLKSSVDNEKAKASFEKLEGGNIPAFKVNIRVHNLLQQFIMDGGFDVNNLLN